MKRTLLITLLLTSRLIGPMSQAQTPAQPGKMNFLAEVVGLPWGEGLLVILIDFFGLLMLYPAVQPDKHCINC